MFIVFFRNNVWWRTFRESLKKIHRKLFFLRNHLKSRARDVRYLKRGPLLKQFLHARHCASFHDQLRYLLALRVLVLVVGSFFERVFSHLKLFIRICFVSTLLVFVDLSSKFRGVAKAHA